MTATVTTSWRRRRRRRRSTRSDGRIRSSRNVCSERECAGGGREKENDNHVPDDDDDVFRESPETSDEHRDGSDTAVDSSVIRRFRLSESCGSLSTVATSVGTLSDRTLSSFSDQHHGAAAASSSPRSCPLFHSSRRQQQTQQNSALASSTGILPVQIDSGSGNCDAERRTVSGPLPSPSSFSATEEREGDGDNGNGNGNGHGNDNGSRYNGNGNGSDDEDTRSYIYVHHHSFLWNFLRKCCAPYLRPPWSSLPTHHRGDDGSSLPSSSSNPSSSTSTETSPTTTPLTPAEITSRRRQITFRILIVLFMIVTISFTCLDLLILHRYLHVWLSSTLDWLTRHPYGGGIAFVLVFLLGSLCFFPVSLLSMGVGYVYADLYGTSSGIAAAFAVCYIGSLVGAAVCFFRSRYLMRRLVVLFAKKYPLIRAVDHAFMNQGFKLMLLFRLSPAVPFNALNYIGGITSVSLRDYWWATVVGIAPKVVWTTALGATFGTFADRGVDGREHFDADDTRKYIVLGLGIGLGVLGLLASGVFARRELVRIVLAEQNRQREEEMVEVWRRRRVELEQQGEEGVEVELGRMVVREGESSDETRSCELVGALQIATNDGRIDEEMGAPELVTPRQLFPITPRDQSTPMVAATTSNSSPSTWTADSVAAELSLVPAILRRLISLEHPSAAASPSSGFASDDPSEVVVATTVTSDGERNGELSTRRRYRPRPSTSARNLSSSLTSAESHFNHGRILMERPLGGNDLSDGEDVGFHSDRTPCAAGPRRIRVGTDPGVGRGIGRSISSDENIFDCRGYPVQERRGEQRGETLPASNFAEEENSNRAVIPVHDTTCENRMIQSATPAAPSHTREVSNVATSAISDSDEGGSGSEEGNDREWFWIWA